MAGPFERFRIRNWIAVSSVTNPICPPSASISRTICPLAIPPTAGLQLICPILFMSIVIRQVLEPKFAAAAASQPACPAPITITSYLKSILPYLLSNAAKLRKSCESCIFCRFLLPKFRGGGGAGAKKRRNFGLEICKM